MPTISRETVEVQLLKPLAHFLRPDFTIGDVHNLDIQSLNERDIDKSIGLIIFDVDNTLEDYLSETVSVETRILLESLRSAGYSLAIASNCDVKRGEHLQTMFGSLVDVIATPEDARVSMHKLWGKKPTTGMYEYIQQVFGNQFSSAQTLMVGDQLLKDVLFGKKAHIRTALTAKFGERDHPGVEKYQRDIERKLLLTMGANAVSGIVQYPEKLTPFKTWIQADSGLVVPEHFRGESSGQAKEY